MKVFLTANAFGYEKGAMIDIAPNMAHYLIASGRAEIPKMQVSKKKRNEAAARRKIRKRAASPLNKMATVSNNK